eukprot:5104957-Heterocapsa_arctica.AAC.1
MLVEQYTLQPESPATQHRMGRSSPASSMFAGTPGGASILPMSIRSASRLGSANFLFVGAEADSANVGPK